ncbi:MAG: GDP-mannose 4,6-dehydratase [Candidatus Cloacimonetes bacterium]|nr:GDP-mannose 4,6-dehydratase [Candidatus Cloacimonadota bacterium]
MHRKILITGGAGFVGSHLAEKYLRAGHEVYVIDNLSTGSLKNIEHIQNNPAFKDRFHVTIDTIFNETKMLELVGICDTVFHLAAAVGVKYILDNPLSSITTNIRGTEIVLGLCNKFRKKVLLASTSEAYGKQVKAPLCEEDDITFGSSGKSRWSYATSKLMDEFMGIAYYRTTKLPVAIVRLFNTVGPRQTGQYGMVIPNFVQQALRDQNITVFGDGSQTRTFTHVREVSDCLMKLIDTPAAYGQVVNIGGTEEISIQSLAERIIKKTGSSSKLSFIPYEQVYSADFEDMGRRVPSTEKLRSLIGFAPELDLDEILEDVIRFIKEEAR